MRKKRLDSRSVDAMLSAVRHADEPLPSIPASVRIRPGDRPFLEGVLLSRSRDEWDPHSLALAGQLARAQHDIEHESRLLESEGSVLTSANGSKVLNPRVTALEQLVRRELSLARSLRLCGRVTGDARKDQGARQLERTARWIRDELLASDDEESLLA